MANEELQKGLNNSLRVATNLSVMLNSKDVLIPATYCRAVLEGVQLLEGFIGEIKKQVDDNKIVPATPSDVAKLNLVK